MEQKQRIGIFGGTFNPPHKGHVRLAVNAANALNLQKVLVMPACIPPHKQPVALVEAVHRVAMCRLAFEGDSRFSVSTLEIERGEKSYTIDTLTALRGQYPDAEFYLIIGSDMLATFTEWFRWQDILEQATLCAASREKGFVPDLSPFTAAQQKKIIFIEDEPFEMSSTALRAALGAGERVSAIDESVLAYIRREGLYEDRFSRYRQLIESKLDAHRLYHSFCVSAAARRLALQYGADADKAELAGLLHDVMKNASPEEQRIIIERGGHRLTPCEKANKKVWHAMAGEAYLRLEEGITDGDILSAVRWHTTGREGMTLLDKIIYAADFISEDRTYPDVEKVRELAQQSLDRAILYTSAYTLRTLAAEGRPIHPATVDCYNDAVIALADTNN